MVKNDSRRDALDNETSEVDAVEAALLGLSAVVGENSSKLDAIIAHFEVPYKPEMGFLKDRPNGQD